MKLQSRYDAVIVGGGHNGLVAAAYLGRAGKSVLVLEKAPTLGGATASKRVFPDYDARLSTYSYLVSLLPPKIIDDLGLKFATKRRTTASFTPYGEAGGLLLSNVDATQSERSVVSLGGEGEWRGYQRFLEMEAAVAQHVWPSFLEPLRAKSDFAAQVDAEAWTSFVEEPLGRAIERHLATDTMRGLVMTDGKIGVFTHPHDPTLLQNRCFLYHVVGGGNGEWRVPVGGMGALVDGLVSVCREAGVSFLTDASATAVSTGEPDHEVSFEHGGQAHHVGARHVLVNAGPRVFDSLLGRGHVADPADEGSVVKINMLLRRLPRVRAQGVTSQEAFAGSFHIDEGYGQMEAAYARAATGELPVPPPGEIYCHTLTDPSILGPELQAEGYQTLTLFGLDLPYRVFAKDHDQRRQMVLAHFLDGLDRVCAEPFRDCLAVGTDGKLCVEVKTPQDLEQEVGLDQGNIFHTNPSWFYAERPEDVGTWGVETDVPRVYRAGSSAHRGGAVSGIPGHNAAMAVLGVR